DAWTAPDLTWPSLRDAALVQARHQLAEAVEELVGVLRAPDVVASITEVDRANLAKYLTIAKLKLENAIAMVRSGDTDSRTRTPTSNREAGTARCRLPFTAWISVVGSGALARGVCVAGCHLPARVRGFDRPDR